MWHSVSCAHAVQCTVHHLPPACNVFAGKVVDIGVV